MSDLARLRWKCRRGTLELDLILARFLDTHYAHLSPAQQEAFESLLEAADDDLWQLVNGESASESPAQQSLIELLRAC